MKPGHKISLTYSTITILLVLVSSAVFYFGTRHYISSLYYNYLEEKARVLAMKRYGQDDLDPVKYSNAVQRSQHAIPTSQELFVPKDSIGIALAALLDSTQIAALQRGEVVHFDHEGEVGTAMLYYDNSGTFASVVLSRNPYGDEIAHTMRLLLVVFILSASLLLWLVSRLWASRMVNRIDQNYQTEKMFVNNAQHEINNPLAVISGECDVTLLRDRSPEEYRSALMRIAKQADRINGIITQLLAIDDARNRPQKAESIDLSEWFFQNELPPHKLYIHGSFRVKMDPDALYIAISNLIGNAVSPSPTTAAPSPPRSWNTSSTPSTVPPTPTASPATASASPWPTPCSSATVPSSPSPHPQRTPSSPSAFQNSRSPFLTVF